MMRQLCLLVLAVGTVALGNRLTQTEKETELKQLATFIQSEYGPRDFKNLNLNQLVTQYAQKAQGTTNLEFYYLINQFVAEFKDSHFSSRLDVSHIAYLGFLVDRIGGQVIIESIDRTILPEAQFPFKRGDQITAVDGTPVKAVVEQLASYRGAGYNETTLRMAAMAIPYRSAAFVPAPTGKAKLTILRRLETIPVDIELEWKSAGTPDEETTLRRSAWNKAPSLDYRQISVKGLYDGLPKLEQNFRCNGKTRIQPPQNTVVLLADPFVAYIHPTSLGNVGYLRIPHYYWQSAAGEMENDFRFKQYEWVIDKMEKHTVGLIVDQDHNCGGSVSMVERMVGLFAKQEFKGLEFQFIASRKEYKKFKGWIDNASLATLEGEGFYEVLQLMKKTWLDPNSGFLTPKTTFNGSRMLKPNPVSYTKPVVVLIDELSGSGGDAFPAMMQGIGRAILLGTRTMGAGGHVESDLGPLSYSGNTLRMTKSLFYRPDGTPIENNGAVPDVSYQTTVNDLLNGYQDYQKFYLATLLQEIKQQRR